MPSFARVLAAFAVLLSACAGTEPDPASIPDNGQTYRDAIATLCGVDAAIGASSDDAAKSPEGDTDVLELADRRHEYLQAHVKHPDGIYFYTLFRIQGPKEQSEALRKEATNLKLSHCALADTLAADASRE